MTGRSGHCRIITAKIKKERKKTMENKDIIKARIQKILKKSKKRRASVVKLKPPVMNMNQRNLKPRIRKTKIIIVNYV